MKLIAIIIVVIQVRERNNNYFYKSSSLSALDEIEFYLYNVANDYGFNFGSERRQLIQYEKLIKEPKLNFNKKYFNEKR